MKTIIINFIGLFFVTLTSVAQSFSDNGFNFSVLSTNPNEVQVTGGSDGSSPLTIPSTATDGNGIVYTVTTIGNSAYRNGASNVILPNTITTIGFRAFRDNGGLTTITLPASVTSIGGEAFFGGGLNEVIALGTVPASISNSSFGTRDGVSLEVPDGLEETYRQAGWTGFNTINGEIPIGATFDVGDLRYRVTSQDPAEVEVAARLNGITDIAIPTSVFEPQFGEAYMVTAVGNRAFRNAGINSVVFSNTIETIKNEAFENNNLTTITLPISVTTIATEAFRDNNILTEVISQAVAAPTLGTNSIRNRGDISLTVPNGSEASYVNGGWTGFFSVNGTPFIGSDFSVDGFNYRINGVNPNTVEIRGGGSGTDLVLPSTIVKNGLSFTVTAIGFRAFRSRNLTSVILPDNVEVIGTEALENNNLTTITLPASVTTIATEAFRDNNILIEVISQAITAPTLGTNSIRNLGDISLTVPNGSEASYVNGGWTGFFSINGTPFIGSDFSVDGFNYRINGVNPNTVELRGGGSGTDLVLPSTTVKNGLSFTVTTIGLRAFRSRNLTSVILPTNVEVIGTEALENNNLTTITLPASVTTIATEAFRDNNILTEVISQAVVAPTLGTNSIRNRGNISLTMPSGSEASYVNGGWTGFFSINGTPFIGSDFSADGFNYRINGVNPNTVELRGGTVDADPILPSTTTKNGISFTVTAIGFRAFRSRNLNSVVLPTNVEVIGEDSFEANNLTSIIFPASVSAINEEAFLNNDLTQVAFNSGPETIGVRAFRNNQLSSVTIPNGTVTIEEGAFINNTISSISLPNSLDVIGREAFLGNQLSSITIPTGVITIGRAAFRDNNLITVVLPNTVQIIDTDAFLDNQITSVNLPSNLTTLGSSVFRNNQLTSIVIPDGITVINSQTFRNNNIQSVTLPANLQSIKSDSFRDNEIESISFPSSLIELQGFSFRNNKLTSVTTPANISTIALHTFSDNLLTDITITSNITSIQNEAFLNNPINTITADSATPATIESNSFGGRSAINLSIIPNQQTVIDDYVAAGWTGFASVNGEFQIGARFTEGDLRYEVIAVNPNEVTVLDIANGLQNQNIIIPATVTESFSGTTFNVTEIADNAFQNTGITSVVIGANVTSIGSNAFTATPLTAMDVQATTPPTIVATSLGDRSAINLTIPNGTETAYVNAGWTGFFSVNGELSDGAIGTTFVDGGITFEITSLSPNEVAVVDGSVTGNIAIPAQTTFNTENFSITTIAANAFQNDDITSVTLPVSITNIGANAFSTDSLTEVIALGTTPATIETNSFGANENISLTIPNGTETTYEAADWTGFFSVNGNGVAIGNRFTVNGIRYEILTLSPNTLSAVGRNGIIPNGDYVFPELISKGGLDFTITTIGNSAFRNRGVRTISLPSTLTTIEFRGFRDNVSLRSVTIPAGVTFIRSEAFFSTGLTEIISESVNPATVNSGTFGGNTKIDLFIPQGTRQAYLDANWTGFKSIIEQGTVIAEPKAYLQGAFLNPNTGEEDLMRDDLRVAGIIPTASPYADGITCNASVFNKTGNDAIVDWVFVELRDAIDSSIVIESRSALLQRDGDIVDINGSGILQFTSPIDNYFVAIRHRNHLGIMSSTALQLDGNRVNIDFTNATIPITFGSNAQTDAGMPVDTLGMWSGNVNGDSIVQYSGTDPDAPAILSLVLNDPGNFLNFSTFAVSGYDANDLNLDGNIQYEGVSPDAPFILQNVLAHPGNFLNFSTFQIQEQLPEN